MDRQKERGAADAAATFVLIIVILAVVRLANNVNNWTDQQRAKTDNSRTTSTTTPPIPATPGWSSKKGETALMIATMKNCLEVAKLIEKGADVNAKNNMDRQH